MMNGTTRLVRVAAGATLLAVVACQGDAKLAGPTTPIGGEIFRSYVSLGNSITAGWQSGGLNDSLQRRSYAVLLGQAMGTRFAYPSLTMPGCPPPQANFVTGALVGGTSAPPCSLRGAITDVLNNVAVPFAAVADPTAKSPTTVTTALPTFILGGLTQVERALVAKPTFASIWIGNNDALLPAITGSLGPTPGTTPGLTPIANFQASYKAMLDQLVAGAPGIKGVLIGVGQVVNTPVFIPAAALANPLVVQALSAATGRTVTFDPSCPTSGALISARIVQAIKSQAHPPFISCTKNVPQPPLGDVFVLDVAEQATLRTTTDAYNTYIKSQADALGFAYYDPNVLLAAKRASGEIPVLPNFTSATAPFGAIFSLDGVHPSSAAHVLIANELIAVINAKYGTTLKPF